MSDEHKYGFGICPDEAAEQELLTRLSNHIACMAPHQKERYAGKLLIEAYNELKRLTNTRTTQGQT